MTSSQNHREFYEHHYRKDVLRNPAYIRYDGLRIHSIQDLLGGLTGSKLIVGSGSGMDLQIFPKITKIYAFDQSYQAVRKSIQDSVVLFVGDARSIPIPSGIFSMIVCSEVLEHIPETQTAIRELRRVLKSDGTLIITTPNWKSWFGLARCLGEKIVGHSLHSDDQPYDDWKTLSSMKKELAPYFKIVSIRGVWYLPPLHYKNRGVSEFWMKLIYRIYLPFEYLLSRILPSWGHILVMRCKPT